MLHGQLSLAEIGHTIIDRASYRTVEQLGSGTALSRLAGEDAAAVGARALDGDEDARAHFTNVAESFAIGVFNLAHCFSPEIVVVGGGMARTGELLLEPIRRALRQCDGNCPPSRGPRLFQPRATTWASGKAQRTGLILTDSSKQTLP